MFTVVKITLVGLLFVGHGASLNVSSVSKASGSSYRKTKTLQADVVDDTAMYYDNHTIGSNRLFLSVNSLDPEAILLLYNDLSRFTHNDDEGVVDEHIPFVLYGYYVQDNFTVQFSVLLTEKKAKLIQKRMEAEFSKNDSIIKRKYRYSISSRVVLQFDHMKFMPESSKVFVVTLQDHSRLLNYGSYIMISYYCMMGASALISIPGSLLICASILKYKHMQTLPNVYVFGLALTDTVQLPLALFILILGMLKNSDLYTRITIYVIDSLWKCTCWTTVGITIDRYIAICHPFLGRRISTFSRAVKINVIIYAMSFIATMIEVIIKKLYINVNDRTTREAYLAIYSLILLAVLPVCIILPSYICIVWKLWKSSKMRQSCSTHEQPLNKKGMKIAAVIVVHYFFCWVPFSCVNFLIKTFDPQKYAFFDMLFQILSIDLVLLGFMFDPILYALLSKDFRNAFKDLGLLCLNCIRRLLCCGRSARPVDNRIVLNNYKF